MPAPKGNKYYLEQSIHGRQKEFDTPAELWEAFLEYRDYIDKTPWLKKEAIKSGHEAGKIIDIPTARPYTLGSFASYIGLTLRGLQNYGSKESHKAFFHIYTRIENICYNNKYEGAVVGAFNANIIARDLGLTDNSHVNSDITINWKETLNEPDPEANDSA